MNILRQAAQQEIKGTVRKPKPAEDTSGDVDIITISDRNPEHGWRRMALKALAVVSVAQKEVMLQELMQSSLEKEAIPEELFEKKKGKKQQNGIPVKKVEIMMRPCLTPSKSFSRIGSMDPKECQHRWLVPRGGKTYWWTCRTCPMRWPRSKDEFCCDEDTIAPDKRR